MADTTKKWWQIFGADTLAVMLGGILGSKLATKENRTIKDETIERAGVELKKVLTPHREEVMKELLALGENGAVIVKLLREANEKKFITTTIQGESIKRYSENWIVNMLLKIDAEDRQWVYALLNDICERDRNEFFTHLEILCNDGLVQWVHIFYATLKDHLPKWDEKLKPIADRLEKIADGIKKKNQCFKEQREKPLLQIRGKKIPRFKLYR